MLRKKIRFCEKFLESSIWLALHNFSRCDLTSVIHRLSKRKWLNIDEGKKEYYKAPGLLGESLEDHLFDMIENMVYQVYRFLNKT